MPSLSHSLVAAEFAEREFEIRQAIVRQRRPTFGTRGMRRTARCILLAAEAMFRGGLPEGSVITIADAFGTEGWEVDIRSRRSWVDLPDSWSWEPVECTTLPTPEFYHRADPQEIVRYRNADELRAALRAEGFTAGDGKVAYYMALNELINGGVPASGDLAWEERPGLVIAKPPRRPGNRTTSKANGLTPGQLRERGIQP